MMNNASTFNDIDAMNGILVNMSGWTMLPMTFGDIDFIV
jgi:hypothetical protein